MSKDPNIISIPPLSGTPNAKGVGCFYHDCMVKHGQKVAQTDSSTNKQETFETLRKRCVRAAIEMQNMGIKPGDFISICTLTDFDTCVPYIASFFVGAITAAVDPEMSVSEIVYLLKQVLPKMIFVSNEAVGLIEEVVLELGIEVIIVVFGETTTHTPFLNFLNAVPNEINFKPIEVNNLKETALVIYSSGTTGRPKGICHSHFSILSNNIVSDLDDHVTIASFCTLYWSVLHAFLHTSIINGFERLIFLKFNADNPWEILNFKITMILLTPISSMAFTKHEKPLHVNLKNLSRAFIAGFRMPEEDCLKLKAVLPETTILPTYGQTEVFKILLSFPNTEKGRKLFQKYPNSVGCPLPGISYKVVDLNTEENLGPNQTGELRIKSDCQTTGYFKQDSTDVFDSEGWLKTGDLAYYNEDMCFFITDRIKESFKYLGYHISPVEIETVLLTHPSVKYAVVLGLPHRTDVNHPMAVVVLNEDREDTMPEEIIKYVEERVEDKKRLRGGIKIMKSIPMTVSNKFSRVKIRKMIENNEI